MAKQQIIGQQIVTSSANGVKNANLSTTAGEPGGAWTTWSPTITAETGTFTTVSSSNAKYTRIGNTIIFKLTITITTAGTASGALFFTLPVNMSTAAEVSIGYGRENQSTGSQLQVASNTTSKASVFKYDGLTIIASSRTIELKGVYEAA